MGKPTDNPNPNPTAANPHGAVRLAAGGAAEVVPFTFDGRPLTGFRGEPLLAALLAGGVRVLRTMPKSGEARGGYCLVGRCTDCAVVVDGLPNVRACREPLRDGMAVETQRGLGPERPS